MAQKYPNRIGLWLALAVAAGCTGEVIEPPGAIIEPRYMEHALAAQSWKLWMPPAGSVITSIPVCFEKDSGLTPAERGSIQTFATEAWDSPSRVSFTGWGTCIFTCRPISPNQPPPGPFDSYNACQSACPIGFGSCIGPAGILVAKDTECDVDGIGSAISGVHYGLTVTAPIERDCVVHEFGHALGFTHEQERTDNDDGNGNLICDEDRSQSQPDLGITTFDNDSVMSYCGPDTGVLTAKDREGLLATYGSSTMTIPYTSPFTFAPRIALRASSRHFIRATSTDVNAEQLHIQNPEKFGILKSAGSSDPYLRFGDSVFFIAADGKALRALGSAQNWVVDKSSASGSCEKWTIVNPLSAASTAPVRVNDEVAFRSCFGRHLYRQSDNGNVRAHNTAIQGLEKWRIISLPHGSLVN